jgi:ribose transport system substrate-binding protein
MKKVLKTLSLILTLCFMVSLFAACGSSNTPKEENATTAISQESSAAEASGATETENKKIRLGVIYLTAEHPYYQAHAKHTEAYAIEKGIDLVELDGKLDQANMATQMENLIAQKVDGIIYCLLDGKAAAADINATQAAGIPVITFAIKHDPTLANCTFVGLDEKAAGAMGGEEAGNYFLKNFPGQKAKIAAVEMVGTTANTDRSDGFIDGFKKVIPDAEVVKRLNGEGKKDKAMAVVEDALQTSPDINVWFGANGDQGLGALAALEANGRGTVKTDLVVSHDGSEPELLKIAEANSALKIANANNPKELAQKTIDTILEMINKTRDMKNTDDIFVPTAVITGADLDAAQKFLKEEFLSETILVK